MPWANARVAHLLSVSRMMAVKVGDGIAEESSSDDFDQLMFTQNVETVEAFSSHMVLVKAGRAYTGECINIMVQALQTEDSSLPQGLTIQNMYMEAEARKQKSSHGGEEQYSISTDPPKENPSGQGSGALLVPEPPREALWQEEGNEPQDPHTPKLTVRQRHGKLFHELDLSGLGSWPPDLVNSACQLLAKYHDIFSLDPMELGCTHSHQTHDKSYR